MKNSVPPPTAKPFWISDKASPGVGPRRGQIAAMAKDPCIGVCKIDKKSGFCRGCRRTKGEIKTWKKLSKKARRAVLEDLPGRD